MIWVKAGLLGFEGGEVAAAFADDIGLVLADITRSLPRILSLFQSFGNHPSSPNLFNSEELTININGILK